jgi:glycosyltransferase involved in cell wall biosynthesis
VSPALRIGIDARELLGQTTGVGRYLGELLHRWTRRGDTAARRLLLYSPEPLRITLPEGTAENRIAPGGRGTWWEQTALGKAVRRDRPDVFFAPAYTAPVALGIPLAVTIHDISFIAHPEWFRPRERWRRRVLTSRTARTASVVLTDSEFSRREIQERIGIPPERLRVIPPGLEARTGAIRASATGLRVPLVLFVGSLFNRRRLPDLIRAFATATADRPEARLVIVGADRTWPRQDLRAAAAAARVDGRTDIVDYASEAELAKLYAQASVFAFLSEYEGFGLTPLEALAAGVPIVVLDTPVAREVYGPAAEYVSAGDIDGTAAALRRFLVSAAAGREQLARAPAVLARYSWDQAADETLRLFEALAR